MNKCNCNKKHHTVTSTEIKVAPYRENYNMMCTLCGKHWSQRKRPIVLSNKNEYKLPDFINANYD